MRTYSHVFQVEIHVKKVRNKLAGSIGFTKLDYDAVSGAACMFPSPLLMRRRAEVERCIWARLVLLCLPCAELRSFPSLLLSRSVH